MGLLGQHPDAQPALHHGHDGGASAHVHRDWVAGLGRGPRRAGEAGGVVLALLLGFAWLTPTYRAGQNPGQSGKPTATPEGVR